VRPVGGGRTRPGGPGSGQATAVGLVKIKRGRRQSR
jgi:hypothetical protein